MSSKGLLSFVSLVIIVLVGCADGANQASIIQPIKPVFTTENQYEVVENKIIVGNVAAYDPSSNEDVSIYLVSNAFDSDQFIIDSNGKALSFKQPPDYEIETQRQFTVQVEAKTTKGYTSTLDIVVMVTNENDSIPQITPSLANISIETNTINVAQLTATDLDGNVISFSLQPSFSAIPSGGEMGADQSLFEITTIKGAPTLAFKVAPNASIATIYNLTVYAEDGLNLGYLKIKVTLVSVLPSVPVFTTGSQYIVTENSTIVGVVAATEPSTGNNVSISLVPGTFDSDRFFIGTDGQTLTFKQPPDFENISQRTFTVQVEAKTLLGVTSTLDISIAVSNVNDNAPVITPNLANITIDANTTLVTSLTATDLDANGPVSTFSVVPPPVLPVGGELSADQALFEITMIGGVPTLAFITLPDIAVATVYTVTVYASDGVNTSFLKISVSLLNIPGVITQPVLTMFVEAKHILFEWGTDSAVAYYELWEDTDGAAGPLAAKMIGGKIAKTAISYPLHIAVYTIDWLNITYTLRACDTNGINCLESIAVIPKDFMLDSIGNLIGNNTETIDNFGSSMAISNDGNTIAIGASGEASFYNGICHSPSVPDVNGLISCTGGAYTDDNSAQSSGAVYIFQKNTKGFWFLEAFIKPANSEAGDLFGYSVSLIEDSTSPGGMVLAVGAPGEDGSGYTDETGPFIPDVVAPNCSTATNNQDNCVKDSGVVYIFNRDATNIWAQTAYLKDGLPSLNTKFGNVVDWDGKGTGLAVGSQLLGEVYVFIRNAGNDWVFPPELIQPRNFSNTDLFGASISYSNDGRTLAVGAPMEDASFKGVCTGTNLPDPAFATPKPCGSPLQNITIANDDLSRDSGAVYIFTGVRVGTGPIAYDKWTQAAFLKASNAAAATSFGSSVSLNSDGSILAVGSPSENSNFAGVCNIQSIPDPATGTLCGNMASNTIHYRDGAVYLFNYNLKGSLIWTQEAYVKPANTGLQINIEVNYGDEFGTKVSISDDGKMLAVGSPREDSTFAGVNYGKGGADANLYTNGGCKANPPIPSIENNCATDAGAIYVFSMDALSTWNQQSFVKTTNTLKASEFFGRSFVMSPDGGSLVTKTINSVNLY